MSKFILSAFADEAEGTLTGQIAALKRNGISLMEIRNVNGMNICDTPLETVREYKKQLDAAGISVVSVGSRIGKVSPDEPWVDHLAVYLHTLAAAKILGARKMRMFSIFTNGRPEAYRDEIFEKLEQMLALAESAGIILCHENEKGIYGDDGGRVTELMERYAKRMGFIFDPANYIQCGCDPLELYRSMRSGIDYFHIKDCHKESGIVAASGEGDGHIAEILRDFAADHEDVMLTVEPHLMQFVGLKDDVSVRSSGTPRFADSNEAFDYAVNALKKILNEGDLSYV